MAKRISPQQRQRVIDAVRGGNFLKDAAMYGGIAESTIYAWIQEYEQATDDEPCRPFVLEFVESLNVAKAEAAMVHVQNIRTAALGRPARFDAQGNLVQTAIEPDWKASGWYLERTRPRDWSLTMRQEIEHTVAVPEASIANKLNEALEAMDLDGDDPDDPENVLELESWEEGGDGGESEGATGEDAEGDPSAEAGGSARQARSGSSRRSLVVRRTA